MVLKQSELTTYSKGTITIAHYFFNEANGNVMDIAGQNHLMPMPFMDKKDGNRQVFTSILDAMGGGFVRKGVEFLGTGAFVHPVKTALDITTQDFTIEA